MYDLPGIYLKCNCQVKTLSLIGKAPLQESKQQKVAKICKDLKVHKNKKIRNFSKYFVSV
jgi:hypothetical protein